MKIISSIGKFLRNNSKRKKKTLKQGFILSSGITAIIKPHAKSKRIKLKYDAAKSAVMITLPPHVSAVQALEFAEEHEGWIKKQHLKYSNIPAFQPNHMLPFRGKQYLICHDESRAPHIWLEEDRIIVGGRIEGFNIRLENWLKRQAKAIILQITQEFEIKLKALYRTKPLGHRVKPLGKISIRDTKSRWGSCSGRGNISLSYRLIMAPEEIMTYVIAHEIAHLKEMNHSEDFWDIVDQLVPNARTAKKWLNHDGQELMLIR